MSTLLALDRSESFLSSSAAMLLTVNSPTDILLDDRYQVTPYGRANKVGVLYSTSVGRLLEMHWALMWGRTCEIYNVSSNVNQYDVLH